MAFVTSGDPGRPAMAALQETIRGNVNARHPLRQAETRRLREGPPSELYRRRSVPLPRGVSVVPDEIALTSVISAPSVIVPRVRRPAVLSNAIGSGQSVSLSLETAVDDVTGVVSPALRGPWVCRSWFIMTSMGETTAAQWNLFRVDFAENSQRQDFTFANASIPTGGRKDGLGLWQSGAIAEQSVLDRTILNEGWTRTAGSTGLFVNHGPMPCYVVIPYETFFVKFYAQNDTAGLKFNYLHLEFQRLEGDVGIMEL